MPIKITSASNDSSKMRVMSTSFFRNFAIRFIVCTGLIVTHSLSAAQEPPPQLHPASQWLPVSWSELPDAYSDNPREALGAWLASCVRPQPAWRMVCNELAALKQVDADVLRIWLQARLQPYRVEPQALTAASASTHEGLLTGYYEPIFKATRVPQGAYQYPLYRLPQVLEKNRTAVWLTRQEIDTTEQARAALQDRVIAYLDDPMDVLALQIQGSGQLEWQGQEPLQNRTRLAFAGTNNQPYASVGNWLRQTHGVRELSWPAIKAWASRNPQQLNSLLWSNPRVVFFKEVVAPKQAIEPPSAGPLPNGPHGAAGVPLTAGRSIAVDPQSIPYGTPVWLATNGESMRLSRLVMAQDTGAAIKGAVRADFYVGSGMEAGEIAGHLRQPLQLWVLWPK